MDIQYLKMKLQRTLGQRTLLMHCTAVAVFSYILVLAAIATLAANEKHAKQLSRERYKTDNHQIKHSFKNSEADVPLYRRMVDNNDVIPPLLKFGDVGSEGHIKRGFLTIGISTVQRPEGENIYIINTVKSILENTNETEKSLLTIVISVSDSNQTWNQNIAKMMYSKFKKHCDLGLIQIIQPSFRIYPNFTKLEGKNGENMKRAVWRSKQNVDFAYLMLYSRNFSEYYMQLEDDMLTDRNFMKDIKVFVEYLNRHHHSWKILDFSRLGFIGKLFHKKVLDKVAYFFLSFYDQKPCDMLFNDLVQLYGKTEYKIYQHSLFQHMGKVSSTKNKMMPSLDHRLRGVGKIDFSVKSIPKRANPLAIINTNLKQHSNLEPQNAYYNTTGYFAKDPERGQWYRITFTKPYNISGIIVSTGDEKTKKGYLKSGELAYSFKQNCKKLIRITKFINGKIDTSILGKKIPCNIHCLSINILKSQLELLKIDKISISVSKDNGCHK